MNAPFVIPTDITGLAAIEAVYAERCKASALLFIAGQLPLHDAVDKLQSYAEQTGLINSIGQNEAQRIMSEAFATVDLLPDDDNELIDACEREIMLAAADLVRRWELADPRDRWRHTGEAPLKASAISEILARPYRTPQATIDAFWYVVSLCNPERLKAWLGDHPKDAPFLLKLLEGK